LGTLAASPVDLMHDGHGRVMHTRGLDHQGRSPSMVSAGSAAQHHGLCAAGVRVPAMVMRLDMGRRDRRPFGRALQPAARDRDTACAHDRAHGEGQATAYEVAWVQQCRPSRESPGRAQSLQGGGDTPAVVLGGNCAATIFELHRERLAPDVADRPLTSGVRAHKPVRVSVYEH
jgi:hypothetical protein